MPVSRISLQTLFVTDSHQGLGRWQTFRVFWKVSIFCAFLLWSGLNDGVCKLSVRT